MSSEWIDDLAPLFDRGLSPAEALDYYAVEVRGVNQDEWADVRSSDEKSVSQQAVSKNVRKARRKLPPGFDLSELDA